MNKTILIIEDEIRIRFLLKDYLLSEGFSQRSAVLFKSALTFATRILGEKGLVT